MSEDPNFPDLVSEAISMINRNGSDKLVTELGKMQADFWHRLSLEPLSENETISKRVKKAVDSMGFNPLLKIVLDGVYGPFLREYLNFFTLDHTLLVLSQEELLNSPSQALSSVFKFLKLEDYLTPEVFVRPGGIPFYCLNVTELAIQNEKFRTRLANSTETTANSTVSTNSTETALTTEKPLRCNSGPDRQCDFNG